ncbi:hypothetical protein [Sorangium sp. So ce362]|uniref:hypothetical protein n=1 Tax=Sorangium sp. So ce362 TaxID=3133303 RepID=UPI003F6077D4
MTSKDQVARELIAEHFELEPHLQAVYRIVAENEASATEPIKLLEVNAATVATGGVTPFEFAPTQDVPFPTVIAEVTPTEFEAIQAGDSKLPKGWRLDRAQRFTRDGLAA